jgi:hypothetical protein
MVPIPTTEIAAPSARYSWLTAERLPRVRAILLAISLFFGLAVYVFHTISAVTNATPPLLITKLRGVGVLTWLYALVQMIDLRFYNSRWARRRRESTGIPDSLHGWLFGQMLAWYGIVYYGITEDVRWYAAGMVIFAVGFIAFPIRRRRD